MGDADDRQANRLRVLAESGHLFAEASTELDRILAVVARRFADLIGDGCFIRLIGPDGQSLLPVATRHPDPETERFLRETTDTFPLKVGEGISGKVVLTGEPVFMPVVVLSEYKRQTTSDFAAVFEQVGITSLIAVRLRARGNNLGFISLTRNGSGRPAYTREDLLLVQDLAERAALAIDCGRLVDELERRVSERTHSLAAVNRELEAFTYSVSHDLRAPLRAIDGFSRILEEDHGAGLDDDARKVIAVIRKNTRRMGQLIDDLLRFSRLGQRAIEPRVEIDMRRVVNAVIAELRDLEPTRTIEVQIGPLPRAYGNLELIHQVWVNLLGNAVKYSRDREVTQITIGGDVAGRELRYNVDDNGTGFDPQFSDKLFGVFQRLHRDSEFEGTGVGLALVHRIVARHGGRVWAEGRPGTGALFGFALPRRGPPRIDFD